MTRNPSALILSATFAVALQCTVCCGPVFPAGPEVRVYADEEARVMLRSELDEFERYTEASMKDTRDILKKRKVSAGDLASLETWQTAQLARIRTALHQEDPLAALVDAWAVSKSLTRYLEQQPGQEALPESIRLVALDMLRRRDDRLAHMASRYLPGESIQAISGQLDAFVTTESIPVSEALQPDSRRWTSPLFSAWSKSQAAVGSILQVPLMPGRALMGVSESGKALSGLRETTAEAVQVASKLPERIRTEFQLALADLVEHRQEILELLAAVDSVSTNLRATAEATQATATQAKASLVVADELLPAAETLAAAVERAVKSSTELVTAISGLVDQPSAAPGATAAAPRSFDVQEYRETAGALAEAAREVHDVLTEVRALVESGREPPGDDSEPFDIRDYEATAAAVERSAAEIRGILDDLREMAADEGFQDRLAVLLGELNTTADHSTEKAKGVVDHLALRLIQTAVAVFFLACVYAYLRPRFAGRTRRDQP